MAEEEKQKKNVLFLLEKNICVWKNQTIKQQSIIDGNQKKVACAFFNRRDNVEMQKNGNEEEWREMKKEKESSGGRRLNKIKQIYTKKDDDDTHTRNDCVSEQSPWK